MARKFKPEPLIPQKTGAVGALTPKQGKKLWKELENERKMEEIAAAEGRSYSDERKKALEDEENKDAWRKLIAEAKVKFPEALADKFELTPNKKLCGIARMLGWSNKKIHQASGINEKTLRNWFNKPDLKEFMDAFEYYQGTKDGKDMLKREIYPSIQVLKEIRDDMSAPASVRRDISQWFFEQLHGKAKETREVKGQSIKALTQELMNLKGQEIDELELEDELEEIH